MSSTGSNKENGAVNYVLAHLEFDAVPLTSRTTRLFLGQQIQCTQCHDHPSNDWKQIDFWGINAFFKGMKTEDVRKPDATGLEAYDHTELRDEPTDNYVRFDRRNGLVGVAFPRFLDGRKISQGTDVIRRAELGQADRRPQQRRCWPKRSSIGCGPISWDEASSIRSMISARTIRPAIPSCSTSSPRNSRRADTTSRSCAAGSWPAGPTSSAACTKQSGRDKDDGLFSQMQLKPMTPRTAFRLAADGDEGASGRLGR